MSGKVQGKYHPLPHSHAGAQRRTLGGSGTHLDRAAVMAAPRDMDPGAAFLDATARRWFIFRCSAVFWSSIARILRSRSAKVCSFTSCCKASCSCSSVWGSSSPNGTRLLILERGGASLMGATAVRGALFRRVLQQTSAAGDSLGRMMRLRAGRNGAALQVRMFMREGYTRDQRSHRSNIGGRRGSKLQGSVHEARQGASSSHVICGKATERTALQVRER